MASKGWWNPAELVPGFASALLFFCRLQPNTLLSPPARVPVCIMVLWSSWLGELLDRKPWEQRELFSETTEAMFITCISGQFHGFAASFPPASPKGPRYMMSVEQPGYFPFFWTVPPSVPSLLPWCIEIKCISGYGFLKSLGINVFSPFRSQLDFEYSQIHFRTPPKPLCFPKNSQVCCSPLHNHPVVAITGLVQLGNPWCKYRETGAMEWPQNIKALMEQK